MVTSRWTRAVLLGLTAAILAAAVPSTASAYLRMYGAKDRHWSWAKDAQAHVPLPDSRVTLDLSSCPYINAIACMTPSRHGRRGTIYLPHVGQHGVSYDYERLLFLHELGHVADFRHLTRAERDEFRAAVGTTCSWWSTRCTIHVPGDPRPAKAPPGEWFADTYASCALDYSQEDFDQGGPTYGWKPTLRKAELCALVTRLIAH